MVFFLLLTEAFRISVSFLFSSGKSRLLWTDLILALILLGGLITLVISGCLETGGAVAVIDKARRQNHFQLDSFSFNPTAQVSTQKE